MAGLGAVIYIAYFLDLNQFKPQIQKAVYDKTGRQLNIQGDIKFIVDIHPTLQVAKINFENTLGADSSYLFKADAVVVSFFFKDLLKGHLALNTLDIIKADVSMEVNAMGRFNIKFGSNDDKKATDGTPKQKSRLFIWEDVSKITISDSNISYSNKAAKSNHEFMVTQLTLDACNSELDQAISIAGVVNGERFMCNGRIGNFKTLMNRDEAWLANLHIQMSDADFKLNGSVKNPSDIKGAVLDFEGQGNDIRKILHMIKVDMPIKDPFRISGLIELSDPKKITIKKLVLKTILGESAGSLNIDLTGKIPVIQGNILFSTLNLADIKKSDPKKHKKEKKNHETDLLIPDIPIPIGFFDKCLFSFNVKIKRLLLSNFVFENINLHTELSEKYLIINPLVAKIENGDINCKFSLNVEDESSPQLISIIDFQDLELSRIMNNLKLTDRVSGRLDGELKLRTFGKSSRKWFTNMEGKVRLLGEQGIVDYQLLKYLGNDLASGLVDLLNPVKKTEKIDINCFVSAFDVYNGRAQMVVCVLDSSHMCVLGEGEMNLNNEELDFYFKSMPKKGIDVGTLTKLNINAAELIEPFKLSGTLKKPMLAVDLTQTGIMAIKMVGGMMLFGPAGIAAMLINAESADENPCLIAIKKAQQGINTSKDDKKGSLSDLYERKKSRISDILTNTIDQIQF